MSRIAASVALSAARSVLWTGESVLNPSVVLTISERLSLMRGAAMKLGQMLSIQDGSELSPALAPMLSSLRNEATIMPTRQLIGVLAGSLGEDWRSRFGSFEETPFAAASIGQVHAGTLLDGSPVAIKVQYPRVGETIAADLRNLAAIAPLMPAGLFADRTIKALGEELVREADYRLEARAQMACRDRVLKLQRAVLPDDDHVSRRFVAAFGVPKVVDDLSTDVLLTAEFVAGRSVDAAIECDQETRSYLGSAILWLTLVEIFVWNVIQADPNWANFVVSPDRGIQLIDFGASVSIAPTFAANYARTVVAAANQDRPGVHRGSLAMGFLSGDEDAIMKESHMSAVMILGEPFARDLPYDFSQQTITTRVREQIGKMIQRRIVPPPKETYALHRKLAGAYLLCSRLGARVPAREILTSALYLAKKAVALGLVDEEGPGAPPEVAARGRRPPR